jgi:hypothetical protein
MPARTPLPGGSTNKIKIQRELLAHGGSSVTGHLPATTVTVSFNLFREPAFMSGWEAGPVEAF